MRLTSLLLFLTLTGVSFAVEVVIGFGNLTPDQDIIKLLDECNGKIRRLWYSTPYGGGGSSAHEEAKNNSEFVNMSREKIKIMLGKYGYIMTGINLQIALKHTELKDITSSKELEKYITGLLNSFYLQKLSHEYVASGKPIYFAVLAEINSEKITCLENNKLVKDIIVNDSLLFKKFLFKNFLKYVPYYFKPKNIPEKYFHPKLRNINADELYRMLNETVQVLRKDPEFQKFINSEEFKEYEINTEKYYINKINRIRQHETHLNCPRNSLTYPLHSLKYFA